MLYLRKKGSISKNMKNSNASSTARLNEWILK